MSTSTQETLEQAAIQRILNLYANALDGRYSPDARRLADRASGAGDSS
ncbi:hypothetical protein [Pseudomonas saliphila]|nr:hypothetical protein [Pseudomonas saliphila]